MTYRIELQILAVLLWLLPIWTLAQTSPSNGYLQNVGAIDSIYSESLEENRTFYVQFPDNYNPQKQYPVVYILDGEVLLPTVSNVQRFYSGGFTPDMILIGISNTQNRTRDLTTSMIKEMNGRPFHTENGGADNFRAFIETELIPYIENKYSVTKFRTLIGHSHGGQFTIDVLVNHPHLFSNYLAIDPSLYWDDQKLLNLAKDKLPNQNYKGKSLFISLSGQLHMQNPEITIDNVMEDSSEHTIFARSIIAFSNLINQNNHIDLSFEWKFYPRDLHGTIPYPSIMDGLVADFEWFQMENTDKFNSPTTSKEELSKIINYRAKKLANYFKYAVSPYPEDLLNVLGYMSLDIEQIEKSKMFFEFAMKYYPNSANTYDSMADFYIRTEDSDKALKYVTKAFELSGDAHYKQRMESLKKN